MLLLQKLGEVAYAPVVGNVELRKLDLGEPAGGRERVRREQRRVMPQPLDGVGPARPVARGEVDEERPRVQRGFWVLERELPDDC
jgi:hypothetical protein